MTKFFRTGVLQQLTLAVLLISTCLSTTSMRAAVTFTEFVETPTSLSFNFSATNFASDLLLDVNGLTNFWDIDVETHANAAGGFGFKLRFLHNPFGVYGEVGALSPLTPYGTPLIASAIVPHGSDFDAYSLNITVDSPTGAYSGSLSAVHRAAGVPDGGATGVLLGFAFVGLVAFRRWNPGMAARRA
jgi:hypothetical protein